MKRLAVEVTEDESNFLSPVSTDAKELASAYRSRRRTYDIKSVHPADVIGEEAAGWEVQRSGKRATRLKRLKSHDKWLEDRVWCLLYPWGTAL